MIIKTIRYLYLHKFPLIFDIFPNPIFLLQELLKLTIISFIVTLSGFEKEQPTGTLQNEIPNLNYDIIRLQYIACVFLMHYFGLLNIHQSIIKHESYLNLFLTLTVYPYIIEKIIFEKYVTPLFMASLFFKSFHRIPDILTIFTISANAGFVIAQLIFVYTFMTKLFEESKELHIVTCVLYGFSILFKLEKESSNLVLDEIVNKIFTFIFKVPKTIFYIVFKLNTILGFILKIVLLIGIIPGVYYSFTNIFSSINF